MSDLIDFIVEAIGWALCAALFVAGVALFLASFVLSFALLKNIANGDPSPWYYVIAPIVFFLIIGGVTASLD